MASPDAEAEVGLLTSRVWADAAGSGAEGGAEGHGPSGAERRPRAAPYGSSWRGLWRLAAGAAMLVALALVGGHRAIAGASAPASGARAEETVGLFQLRLPHFNLRNPFSRPSPGAAQVGVAAAPMAVPPMASPPASPPSMLEPAGVPGAFGSQGIGPSASSQLPVSESFDCNTGYHESNWVEGWSPEQMRYCCSTYDRGCQGPRLMSFYMYRAQSNDNYPMNNVNMADLPGLFWYLHNEVVVSTPRKYNVTRVLRFRVTMKTTEANYAETRHQFGPYTAFDSARCNVPNCDQIFERIGFVPGCQNTKSAAGLGNYVSLSSVPCIPPACKEGAWYSLPGPCPSQYYDAKEDGCNVTMPGGECKQPGYVSPFEAAKVEGTSDCTFYAKWAGQISLDELTGMEASMFRVGIQEQEYSVAYDTGICDPYYNCSWWAGRNDQAKCAWRMQQLENLFKTKFPSYPATLEEAPPCNAA